MSNWAFYKKRENPLGKYYVYRFLDSDGIVIYVGRTTNLPQRLANHDHKTDEVKRVEYIECLTEADMVWKEIYYINLFYNEKSMNVQDVYDGVTDLHLNDKWKQYTKGDNCLKYNTCLGDEIFESECCSLVENPPKYNYKKLIHVLDHEKMNEIGKKKNALSRKWYLDNCENYIEGEIKELRNHTTNYIRHISQKYIGNNPDEIIWTTYSEFVPIIKNRGYMKRFVNPYYFDSSGVKDKRVVAYLCNHYLNSFKNNGKITHDEYAIFLLMTFLFSTTVLKYGEEIWIYLPPKRMRGLLKQWIEENSVQESEAEFEECAS